MNKVMGRNNIFTADVLKEYNVKVSEKESGDTITINQPDERFGCILCDCDAGYDIDIPVISSLVVSEERIELMVPYQSRDDIILHKLPSSVCKFSCNDDGKIVIEIYRKGREIYV